MRINNDSSHDKSSFSWLVDWLIDAMYFDILYFTSFFFFSFRWDGEREREREECAMCTMVDGTKKGQSV